MEPIDTKPAPQAHRLLRRQIKRYLGNDPGELPPHWQSLLTAVNEAYFQFESDYSILERSLELSSQELREAHSGMRAAYERLILSSMDGVFAFDQQGHFTIWNPAMEKFTGLTVLQTIGKFAIDVFPLFGKSGHESFVYRVLAGETVHVEEHTCMSTHIGEKRFFEYSLAPLWNESREIIGGLGILRDITERKQAEEALGAQHAHLAALQEMALQLTSQLELHKLLEDILHHVCSLMDTPHAFLSLSNPEGTEIVCQFASGFFEQFIGWRFGYENGLAAEVWRSRAPVIHENYPGLPAAFGLENLHGWVGVPLLKGSDIIGIVAVTYSKEHSSPGEKEVALLKQFAQLASIGLVNGALNEANARLKKLATTDSLTGLPNRMQLLERVAEELEVAERVKKKMALLMLDLDRFKEVNDTFGHQSGDLLLEQVGLRLREAVSEVATVARLGGDEFAVFLPSTDEADAQRVASEIGTALERPFLVEDCPHQVEASIGVALYPAHGSDPLTLFRHSDVAMYLAKGKHTKCAFYNAYLDHYSPRRLVLLGDLRRAIAAHELQLYYQPKAELRTGRVKSVEALLRWQHPTYGFVPPDQFIPLAEQTGLIQPLTHWVLETAVQQCRSWLENGIELAVAVNLSMWNLRDTRLPDIIAGLLERYRVLPSLLCVEVTESAVMADAEHTLQVLKRLFGLGIRIAIDDYGTGYASLSYLKHLPAEELKIDRTFVQHLTTDHADQAIVRSTVNMAHSMGIQVVAEGVEDEASWELLSALRCDIAQGYYLSRPVPSDNLMHWLMQRKEASALQLERGKEAAAI